MNLSHYHPSQIPEVNGVKETMLICETPIKFIKLHKLR